MAFDPSKLSGLSASPVQSVYAYETADSIGAVLTPGYFNSLRNVIRVYDRIAVEAVDGTTELRVTATGDAVAVARVSDAFAPAPQGNGILVANGKQIAGRSLVPGPGIVIENPNGVGGDVVLSARPGRVLLASLVGADLNSVSDQKIAIPEYLKYIVTDILVTNRSATPTAAAGGVYTAPGKAGYTLVGASQSYTALTDATVALPLTLGTQRLLNGPAIYLSLTTANGAACTADVYVFGYWLA